MQKEDCGWKRATRILDSSTRYLLFIEDEIFRHETFRGEEKKDKVV